MNNHEPTSEDMAAAKEQGDLVEMLLAAAGRTRKRATAPQSDVDPPIVAIPSSPLHRLGAWPAGTRPAGPNTCHPDCDCALTDPPSEEIR